MLFRVRRLAFYPRRRGNWKYVTYHRGVASMLGMFLEDTGSNQQWEYLCRSVCHAARLDPDRWENYSEAILGEGGRRTNEGRSSGKGT
jgi:hypothetical protein